MPLQEGKAKRYEEILKEKSIAGCRSNNEQLIQTSRDKRIKDARMIDLSTIMHKPRKYQLEAFVEARKRNIIMCADTGAGKTLTAILLIQSFHRENGAADTTDSPSSYSSEMKHAVKKSVFLAPTVELVYQQASCVAAITGLNCEAFVGTHLDNWTDEKWKSAVKHVECMAFTPQAFLNLILRGREVFDTSHLGLIIFDEAHHAQKNHPYVRVINSFEESRLMSGMRKDIKVFGMTASPTKPCFTNLRCKPYVCDADSEEMQNASAVPPTKVQLYFLDRSDCKSKVKKCLMDLMESLFPSSTEKGDDSGVKHLLTCPAVDTEDGAGEKLASCSDTTLSTRDYDRNIKRPLQDAFDSLGTWPTMILARLLVRDQRKSLWGKINGKDKWQIMNEKLGAASHLIHSTISWAAPNLRRLCSAKVGALVGLLRRTLKNYSGIEPFQCMVFVQRRSNTRALSEVLSDIFKSETDEVMKSLKVGHMVGGETRSSSSTLGQFRTGHIQVLVTTAVCCEGIDIPAVSCVVCMDDITNAQFLIHTRGRCRSKGGLMVILCPHGDDDKTTRIAEMLKEAELIRRNDLSEQRGFYDKDQPLALKYPKLVCRFPSSGAVLDMDIAVPLLSEFLNSFGMAFSPLYVIEEKEFDTDVQQFPCIPTKFSARVILPRSIEEHLKDITLPSYWESHMFFPRKREARAAAAMESCLLLHKAGLINDKLLVVKVLSDVQKLEWWDSSTLVVDSASINIPCCPIMEDIGLHPLRPEVELLAWHLGGTTGLYFVVDKETTDIHHVNAVSEFLGGIPPQQWPSVNEERLQQLRDQHELLLSCIVWSEGCTGGGRWSPLNRDGTCFRNRGYLLVWKPNGPEMDMYFAPTEKENSFRFVFPLMDINGPGIISYRQFREVGLTKKLENRVAKIPEDLQHRFGENTSFLQDLVAKHAPDQQKFFLMYSSQSVDFTGMEDKPLIPCLLFELPRMIFGWKFGKKIVNFVTLVLGEHCELSPISKEHYEAGVKSLPLLLLAERALMSSTLSQKTGMNISARAIDKALKNPDNEVLEFVGDAWLKFYATLSSYAGSEEEICMQEYTMTLLVHNMVSNMRLVKAAVLKGLDRFVHFPSKLSGNLFDYWRPPGFLSSTYDIRWKMLADTVEAIIGAALIEKGQIGPVPFMHWLGLGYLKCGSFLDAALVGCTMGEKDAVGTKQPRGAGIRLKLEHTLEEKLGYKFNNLQLLREAFTHPSWTMVEPGCCRDYQRLEFLGDAVLELLVTIGMVEDETIDMETLGPGPLSKMREYAVCNATLADIAKQLRLDLHIRAAPEVHSKIIYFILGTKKKNPPKTLADLVEALIAAVWIDSDCDFPTLLRIFYYPLLKERMQGSDLPDSDKSDAKSDDKSDGCNVEGFEPGDLYDLVKNVLFPEREDILHKILPDNAIRLAKNLKQAIKDQMVEAIAKKQEPQNK